MWQAVNSKNYRERKKLKGTGQQLQPTSNKVLLVKAKQVQVNGMDMNDVLFFVGNVHDSGLAWRRLSERPGVCSDKSSFKHGEITWEGKTIVRASFSNRPCTKPALTLVTLVCVPHAQTTWYFQASKQNEDPTHGIAAQLRNEGWAVQSGSVDESDDESDEDCS